MTATGEGVLQKSPSPAPDNDASPIESIEKARPAVRCPSWPPGPGGCAVRLLARFASVCCTPVRDRKANQAFI
jgi:hypothetical protein